MNLLQRLKRRLTDAYTSLVARLATFWHRLVDEPQYADAASDLVVCAVAFWCQDQRVVNLVRTLVSTLSSVVRNLSERAEPVWELPWA